MKKTALIIGVVVAIGITLYAGWASLELGYARQAIKLSEVSELLCQDRIKVLEQNNRDLKLLLSLAERDLWEAQDEIAYWQEQAEPPRPFNSVDELQEWLFRVWLPISLANLAGFNSPLVNSVAPDCDDYAEACMLTALADGFLVSTEIIDLPAGRHMINSTIIGNEIYHINPQAMSVIFFCVRD